MNMNLQIALHAPNLINICIDDNVDGLISGRIYHCFTEQAWGFNNVVQMLELMEDLFNAINYPQASTKTRSFNNKEQVAELNLRKVQEQKEVIVHRGNEATFFVHVQYRQNSSWQGQVEWAEKGVLKHFNSELDLVKLISGAIE